MITAITPTGDRPLAFTLCQKWMMNQTTKPDQWLVVDDGKIPMTPFVSMEYIRREPQPGDPRHTLAINLKQALPLIRGDKIIIIEDDEYYAPEYIAEMARRLDEYEIVGICHSKYYHIFSRGYMHHNNNAHASLAETGFRLSFLPIFARMVAKGMKTDWLDTQIWRTALKGIHSLLFVDDKLPLHVGIKGLPGRTGIGVGHQTRIYRTKDTKEGTILRQWIPHDYQVYLDIANGQWTD